MLTSTYRQLCNTNGFASQRTKTCKPTCRPQSLVLANLDTGADKRGSSVSTQAAATSESSIVNTAVLPGPPPSTDPHHSTNQRIREGHYEAKLVQQQASKQDEEQPSIASILSPFDTATSTADIAIVGCGPAGLALAAEVAKHGVKVALIGHDAPFVNNYGVWVDEFKELGLQDTLDHTWADAECFFGEGKQVRVGRPYGRVCRRRLREKLLSSCREAGVQFVCAEVVDIAVLDDNSGCRISCSGGSAVKTRLVTLASGAAAGRFLQYEAGAPGVAAQTAYGLEASVSGYSKGYDGGSMLFMDFRRHHTGLWDDTAHKLVPGEHPVGGDGVWGCGQEVPSFLYAMPLGGGRVFVEETCLVAKPALPFAVLKRRLMRRLKAMGVQVDEIIEEEWSYIPVGGPLPVGEQPITAFGAAANLVHPATGYSIARSLREAPVLGKAIASILDERLCVSETSKKVWEVLWSQEKRRQAAFHVFGMELLAELDVSATNKFFLTFFRLPPYFWRGFLASSLSSTQLLAFALLTFALAPTAIQTRLVGHLIFHPAGQYLLNAYTRGSGVSSTGQLSPATAAICWLMLGLAIADNQTPPA